ncbi:V-type ATP synthase subunit E family protein [Halochromatium salexigens]|uniref:V-type ATP synthase subunit E n=1 Tax=Halochromatium salexigens TaxID=49447 RepID=A0AAJ0XET2_HALSE|nr:ATPase [Halochromatium salexigens]
MTQADQLENAILARAERLATEYRERAQRARDTILREAAEKLRLREQREEAIAKSLGERAYRQQVQAEELKLQSQLDLVRWNLVRDVEARLADQMRAHREQSEAYVQTLTAFIATALAEIERAEVEVRANGADLKLLKAHWADILAALPDSTQARLGEEPIETLGGVLVASNDGRIRVDNTFEGRLARLRSRLQQVILERLVPSGFETGSIFGG